MGVRGVGRGGQVRAQCVGHGERVRLRAAPLVRGFPVHTRAGYSAMCAVMRLQRGRRGERARSHNPEILLARVPRQSDFKHRG
jgi:hypothetical protein